MVKFTLEKREKFYVGQVIDITDGNTYEVKFLRHKGKGKFVWPITEDVSVICVTDIERVLSKPVTQRRGTITFDLSTFKMYKIE